MEAETCLTGSQSNSPNFNQILIQGNCFDRNVNLLIDTGASVSLVATRLVYMLKLTHKIEPTNKIISGIGKKLVPVRGQINMPVRLGNTETNHAFLICDNVDNDFLIGMDMIKKCGMIIDTPNKNIILPNRNIIPFFKKPGSLPKRLKVRCHKTINLPPNSETFIQGKLPLCNPTQDYEGSIEPYKKLTDTSGIFVTGTLSYSKKQTVPIHCINPTPFNVTIYKNQLVAFMEPIETLKMPHNIRHVNETCNYGTPANIPRLATACTVEETKTQGKWDNPDELINQLRIDTIDIPDSDKQKLKKLVTEYSHCFSRNQYDLGCASFYEARLKLKPDYTPKWVPSRQPSYKTLPYLNEEIANLEKAGQISPCRYSLFNSALFAVPKSSGKGYRYVLDARAINSQIVRDSYELPKIRNILDKITECKYWSSFDLTSSFTQIGLEENSRHITAFSHNGKRYMFNRMIQGQTNSSAEFSRCLTHLFETIPFEDCLLIYIDDMLLSSNSISEHLQRLEIILQRLEWGNLKLSPRKTHLFQKEVKFVGHKLSRNGLTIDENKVKAITQLPAPTNVKQTQKLLGMINYHKQFIPKLAETASPLYNLLRKDTPFIWDENCTKSFETIKKALTSAPVLGFVDYTDRYQSYHVTVDSSKLGHGAVLTQWDGNKRRIISYFSKSVPKHMQKLGATKLETLGLLAALKHWRVYLHGTKFKVFTDCSALLNLETIFSRGNAYMQRRLAELGGYQFTVHHLSGNSEEIKIADYLSRYGPFTAKLKHTATQTERETIKIKTIDTEPAGTNQSWLSTDTLTTETSVTNLNIEKLANVEVDTSKIDTDKIEKIDNIFRLNTKDLSKPVTLEEVRESYANDLILLEIKNWVLKNKKPDTINPASSHEETYHFWKNFELLTVKDGILYITRHDTDTLDENKVIVLPHTLIQRVLYTYHNSQTSCHAGTDNSYIQCSKKFYFYKMKREFELWVKACLICNKAKQTKAFKRAPLKPIIYHHFGQAISIDHTECSKKPTPRGTIALLVITDIFTSYIVCVPVKSMKTEETIKHVIEQWILKFGVPNCIHHDLATDFTSKLFKSIMSVFSIQDKPGTSFHSQTQGKVEAQNKRINVCFRACLSDKDFTKYDLYAKYIVFALNNLKSTRTGFSPNFLVFGRNLTLPRDLFIEDDRLETLVKQGENSGNTIQAHAYELYNRIRETTRRVAKTTKQRASYMATQYDKRVRGPFFETNDYCFILVNVPSHKYSFKWKGPFKIVKKINNWNYIIDMNGKRQIVNISKMKEYSQNKYSKVPDTNKQTQTLISNTDRYGNLTNNCDKTVTDDDDDDDGELIISLPQTDTDTADKTCTETNNEPLHNEDETLQHEDENLTLSSGRSTPVDFGNLFDSDDDQEALLDANLSPSRNNDTPLLPQIDEHGRNVGVNINLPSRNISRTSNTLELQSSGSRTDTNYNLRPNPKQSEKGKTSVFKRMKSLGKPKTRK